MTESLRALQNKNTISIMFNNELNDGFLSIYSQYKYTYIVDGLLLSFSANIYVYITQTA